MLHCRIRYCKSPAAGNRQSGLGKPVSKFLIRRIGDELRLDLSII
jgi:hypothetical protein